MKKFALAATAAVATLIAASAQAAIFVSFDGSTTAFSQAADDVFEFTADCGVDGSACGGFETITVEGNAPMMRPGLLHSDNVNVNAAGSGAAAITIWVTRTGLTSLGDNFFSSFTSNNLGGGLSVDLETLISSSNELFGGDSLASFSHSGNGSGSLDVLSAYDTGAGTYSVTQRYTITAAAAAGDRSASPTITLATAAVPEPATWALMIMGFGGAGAMLRQRRTRIATA